MAQYPEVQLATLVDAAPVGDKAPAQIAIPNFSAQSPA